MLYRPPGSAILLNTIMETKAGPISTIEEETPPPTPGEALAPSKWSDWKHYLTSRDGWIGDYVSSNDPFRARLTYCRTICI